MENILFSRKAALFILPMIVASCGGSSEQGLIKNSPDKALAGCTVDGASCNQKVVSGVVAKVTITDARTGDAVIRFATLTDSNDDGDFSDGNFTYSDGNQTIVFVNGVGPDGETIDGIPLYNYTEWVSADIGQGVFVDSNFGVHTDADAVPVDGTALYLGTSLIAHGDDALETIFSETGDSALEVDFGNALADLTIDLDPLDDSITEFDQIVSEDMVIDGYSFTGDEAVLLSGVTDVTGTVLGANTKSGSAGLFFGPVNLDGNPEEFGAVAVVDGDDGFVYGLAAGQVQPVP